MMFTKRIIYLVLINFLTIFYCFGQQGKIIIVEKTNDYEKLFEFVEKSAGFNSNIIGTICLTKNDTIIEYKTWVNGVQDLKIVNDNSFDQKREHCFYYLLRNCILYRSVNDCLRFSFAVTSNSIIIFNDSCDLDSLIGYEIQSNLPDTEVINLVNIIKYLGN